MLPDTPRGTSPPQQPPARQFNADVHTRLAQPRAGKIIRTTSKTMVRTKDGEGGVKSSTIIAEVKKRACLFDTNDPSYGDRGEKSRCWEEVCDSVVPGWSSLSAPERFAAGKEVQKRWRSIRDSYTKMYRQGKCVPAEQCVPGTRRYNYHRELAFLRHALMNKKPRYSQDKYESFSEVSNSPQHTSPEDIPRIKTEPLDRPLDKPLDLKTKPEERPTLVDKANQACTMDKQSLEIKIDANSILPEDHFDDDRLFMNSLIPLFKKMNDDTRLLCRIEVLKIIRYALQGHKCFEALKVAEDSFFKDRMSGILKEEVVEKPKSDSKLCMTTRSADGSRPIRKRRIRSPSPLPMPTKKRGPGRPRKIRPPPSDSDEEPPKRRCPKLKVPPIEVRTTSATNLTNGTKVSTSGVSISTSGSSVSTSGTNVSTSAINTTDVDDSYSKATRVDQLSTPMFMKMYNLARSEIAPALTSSPPLPVKLETQMDNKPS